MGSDRGRTQRQLTLKEVIDWRKAKLLAVAVAAAWAAIFLVAYSSELASVDRYLASPSALPEGRELVLLWDAPSKDAGALKLMDLSRNVEHGTKCQKGKVGCVAAAVRNCPVDCEFTNSLKRFSDASVIFMHPDPFDAGEYAVLPPMKNQPSQMYACFSHEPAWKLPHLWLNPLWTPLCDMTVHWGTGADVETSFYYFDDADGADAQWWAVGDPAGDWIEALKGRKGEFTAGSEDALVSAVVSQCSSAEREEWLQAFMASVSTASYGRCEHNIDFPPRAQAAEGPAARMQEKIDTIARHPFHLAIESTRQESGFMTEKMFQAFRAGVIPIYFGHSATARAKAPRGSFIDVGDFDSIQELADHILAVAEDPELLAGYHAWRREEETAEVFARIQATSKYDTACRICEYAHAHKDRTSTKEGGSLRLREGERQFGKVYTKEDGWELVNTLGHFEDFERRHPTTVASVFNYTVEGSNVPKLFQPWDHSAADVTERFSVWSYRTFPPRIVDMYHLWGVEKM